MKNTLIRTPIIPVPGGGERGIVPPPKYNPYRPIPPSPSK